MPSQQKFMREAYLEAKKSYDESGLPIGAVLVEGGRVIARGHNRRVQDGDPIAHGEMDCLRRAGRRSRYDRTTLYTTLSPCMMCTGALIQFGIPKVVIGDARTYPGHPDVLDEYGVEVKILDDERCMALMRRFIEERPELWDEDIAGRVRP